MAAFLSGSSVRWQLRRRRRGSPAGSPLSSLSSSLLPVYACLPPTPAVLHLSFFGDSFSALSPDMTPNPDANSFAVLMLPQRPSESVCVCGQGISSGVRKSLHTRVVPPDFRSWARKMIDLPAAAVVSGMDRASCPFSLLHTGRWRRGACGQSILAVYPSTLPSSLFSSCRPS